jgi:predicted dehydrogenase
MRTIRWGIIGCGDVTEVKSGPGFQRAEHSRLVAVMRRNGALAKDYAERHGVPRWYDDADALIHDAEVDAVYVATPPSSHMEYVLRCARAGKPVYVEKPMAMSFEECETMIRACDAAAVPLFVAYYRRSLDRFLAIKQLVDSGAIGEVRFVNVTLYQPLVPEELNGDALPWRVDPAVAGGGRFADLASHMLDFLDFALGPIREARGFASNQAGRYRADDIVSGTFAFESGVLGAGTWCFAGFDKYDLTEIVGSAGKISYATFDYRPVVVTTATGVTELTFEPPPHIQQPMIQAIVNALNGKGESPSMGTSAARTSWVMDQMLADSSSLSARR